jgi:DNA ligase-1
MDYAKLVDIYSKIESTTKRLEMTEYLVDLFKSSSVESIDKLIYLTQGKLYPDFVGVELGIAEKLLIKAISFATGFDEEKVTDALKAKGDIGAVAEEMVARKKQRALFVEPLNVEKVYSNFERVAKATGGRSQDLKIKLIAELLHDATPIEARYIVRTIAGKLRLGIADMTIIDGLAVAFADKSQRDTIERVYSICSDLGALGKALRHSGLDGLAEFKIQLGIPIRAMLAERLSSLDEIFEKLHGECAFEYKYDGLRVQAHVAPDNIWLFSRRLENITKQFPDIQNALRDAVKCESAIIEGECVPVNFETGEMLPFQQVSRRRGRIYDLDKAMEEFPVVLFLFDCLYVDGTDLTSTDFRARRNKLEQILEETERVKLSNLVYTRDTKEASKFFNRALEAGCEGLIAKSVAHDSYYRAGARGWQWIKYKREYKSEMADTADLVVVGAFAGHGRRKGVYGALLMAVYNPDEGKYETLCKLGSGFTDEMLEELPKRLALYKVKRKDASVNSKMKADYWFTPAVVMEVLGAEITFSPIHTCAFGELRKDAGLAIRFPRFTGTWREDKSPEQATTTSEIVNMYKAQLKHME